MKLLIYDIETLRVPHTGGTKKPGIEYAAGWRDYKGLGISCIGAYTSWAPSYHAFPQCNLMGFQELADQADVIVGFNSQRFDDEVCKANGLQIRTDYDLLLECWRAAELDPNYSFPSDDPPQRRAKYAGFKLEDLARANLPYGKSSSGDKAPEKWQKGKYKEVLDYCLLDVQITQQLLEFGLAGKLWHAGTRQFLHLRKLYAN